MKRGDAGVSMTGTRYDNIDTLLKTKEKNRASSRASNTDYYLAKTSIELSLSRYKENERRVSAI